MNELDIMDKNNHFLTEISRYYPSICTYEIALININIDRYYFHKIIKQKI